jgi:hypothetical protein
MAAVLALVLLPLVIALGAVVEVANGGLAEILTALAFAGLSAGALVGMLRLMQSIDGPEPGSKH